VMPRAFATLTCVSFRARRSSCRVISSAISSAARASTVALCGIQHADDVIHIPGHGYFLSFFFNRARSASNLSSALAMSCL
jgi:hypothetical protein